MSFQELYSYIDLLWIPLGLLVAHKGQKVFVCGYFLMCFAMLRLQLELMNAISFPKGIIGLMIYDLFDRGILTYGVFGVLYLVLTVFSPGPLKVVFMAFSISLFIAALVVSTIVMVL